MSIADAAHARDQRGAPDVAPEGEPPAKILALPLVRAERQAAAVDEAAAAPPPPRSVLVILHGKRIDDELIREAILQLKGEGHQIHVRVTWDSGDVDLFVKEAVQLWESQGYHTVVAGGGDGTLNEVVDAMLRHGAPPGASVAQLPLGTANDLASAAGISLHLLDALRLALDPSAAQPIDVASVNGLPFCNLATAGPVSGVSSKHMSGALKKLLGPAAVAVAGLRQLLSSGLAPIPGVTVTYPCAPGATPRGFTPEQKVTRLRGNLLVLAAGQARQMGRMVNLCPDACLDDGLLDVTMLFGTLGGAGQRAALRRGVFGPEHRAGRRAAAARALAAGGGG